MSQYFILASLAINEAPTPDGVTKVKPCKFELDSRFDSQNTVSDSFVLPSEDLQVKPDNAPSRPQPPVVMATVTAPKKEPGGEEKGGNVKVQKQMKMLSKQHKRLRLTKGGGGTVKGTLTRKH